MRAVMLEVPEELLADRRRKGLDKRDEVWDGVLHMVPPAATHHQLLAADLNDFLRRVARRRGLVTLYETGLFDPVQGERNYRVPDIVVATPETFSARGVEGSAVLLVDVISPNDESRDKLPFYGRVGALEVWLVTPKTRVVEVFASRDGVLVALPTDRPVISPALGIELAVVAGPKLLLQDGDDSVEI